MNNETIKIADQERAALTLEFIVPLVAADLIEEREPLDDVAIFTLHDMIGELAPDAALLCLALTAQQMVASLPDTLAFSPLKMEADKLVDDYAPLWIAHKADHKPLSTRDIAEQLTYLPEDLEALGDLFSALQPAFARHNHAAMVLCNIMSVQASAHSEAASHCLADVRLPQLSRETVAHADNVIVFPGAQPR